MRKWMLLAMALCLALCAFSAPMAQQPGADDTATAAAEGDALGEMGLVDIPPVMPQVQFPGIANPQVIDIPNDDGRGVGVVWDWEGSASEAISYVVQIEGSDNLLNEYALTEKEQSRLDSALSELASEIGDPLAMRASAEADMAAAKEALDLAVNNKEPSAELRREYWRKYQAVQRYAKRIEILQNRFTAKAGPLFEKHVQFKYLEASLARDRWLSTDGEGQAMWADGAVSGSDTRAAHPNLFGISPSDPDRSFVQVTALTPGAPDGMAEDYGQRYGLSLGGNTQVELEPGQEYRLRMLMAGPDAGDGFQQTSEVDLGSGKPATNYFLTSKLNNLLFAIIFSVVILSSIMMARRNPNMFIRRISGLEAVDEAIGRATEMGKPVLYLCGMQTLADLPTLAAINILGRVARRIADYDSALIVPCRDPVVLTVAQEVVREGFIDVGRPDAYREDNIYFVTEDQFAYTAATCGIMLREKPAANFFMGYYYAESLLLAETGYSTGAIQIAGTDSLSQLPFFITTCDYTLIGEELYAASAYLSREPLLLGSLKGQDLGKALIMLLIILQTILFLFNPEWDFFRNLVTPL